MTPIHDSPIVGWLLAIILLRKPEIAKSTGGKREKEMPLDLLKPKQIGAISQALRAKLLARNSGFGKDYLKLLVNEVR